MCLFFSYSNFKYFLYVFYKYLNLVSRNNLLQIINLDILYYAISKFNNKKYNNKQSMNNIQNKHKHPKNVSYCFLCENDNGYLNIHKDAFHGNIKAIKKSIFDIDTVDFFGNTPLFYAFAGGSKKTIKFLLSKNADINHINILGKTVPFYGPKIV